VEPKSKLKWKKQKTKITQPVQNYPPRHTTIYIF
jgi:hypothetical protein